MGLILYDLLILILVFLCTIMSWKFPCHQITFRNKLEIFTLSSSGLSVLFLLLRRAFFTYFPVQGSSFRFSDLVLSLDSMWWTHLRNVLWLCNFHANKPWRTFIQGDFMIAIQFHVSRVLIPGVNPHRATSFSAAISLIFG